MWLSVSSPQHSQTLFASCFRKCVIKHSVLEAFFCDVMKGTDSYQTKHLPLVVVLLVFLIFQSWGRSNKASFLNREWLFFFWRGCKQRAKFAVFSFFSAAVEVALHNFLTIGISWLRSRLVTTPLNQPALSGGKKSLVINPLQNILKF